MGNLRWKKARGSGTKMCHQFTKSLTVDRSQVVRCKIPGWGQMILNDSWSVITTQLYLPFILSPSIPLYISFFVFLNHILSVLSSSLPFLLHYFDSFAISLNNFILFCYCGMATWVSIHLCQALSWLWLIN